MERVFKRIVCEVNCMKISLEFFGINKCVVFIFEFFIYFCYIV